MAKFVPLADRVLVRRLDEKKANNSLIIIPDSAKEKPQEGEVLAVGPGRRNEVGTLVPVEAVVGDKVLFGRYSGTDIVFDGEELLILREEELLGKVVAE